MKKNITIGSLFSFFLFLCIAWGGTLYSYESKATTGEIRCTKDNDKVECIIKEKRPFYPEKTTKHLFSTQTTVFVRSSGGDAPNDTLFAQQGKHSTKIIGPIGSFPRKSVKAFNSYIASPQKKYQIELYNPFPGLLKALFLIPAGLSIWWLRMLHLYFRT